MSRFRNIAIILSILLAVGVPLVTAYKAEGDKKSYPSIRVDIEPFDPRDLFYGHYLTFNIKWNIAKKDTLKPACQGSSCCLCIGEGDVNPPVSLSQCAPADKPATSCRYILKGNYWGGDTFDIGINRYYVDENHALPLEQLFRDKKESFSIGLGIKPNGKAVVRELYVGDKALQDYVSEHKGAIPSSQKP